MTYDVDKFRAAQEALLRAENAYRLIDREEFETIYEVVPVEA